MKDIDELILSINEKADKRILQKKRCKKLVFSSAISICLVAVISVGAVSIIQKSYDKPQNIVISDNIDNSLKGLAVDNFELSEIQKNDYASDRLAVTKLSDFFSHYSPDMFVYVRVIDTKQFKEKQEGFNILKQSSTVKVISKLWSKDPDIAQTLTISQSLNGGCMGDEKTNMLRKGGVYLLPLAKWENDGEWHIGYDLDVLFEVDDNGDIWSHSQFSKLNFFDGKGASELSKAILAMTSNENIYSAISDVGRMMRNWGDGAIIAELRISSAKSEKNKWGNDCWRYTFSKFNPLLKTNVKNVGAVAFSDENKALEVGSEYLIILDNSEDGPYIENSRVAKIGYDGTISPLNNDSDNYFASFKGYTVEQIRDVVIRAKAWQKEFGDK